MQYNQFNLIDLYHEMNIAEGMMIQAEARKCFAKSKHYHGKCWFKHHARNCKAICRHESFIDGKCSHGICYCSKPCGTRGYTPPPPPPPTDDDGGDTGGDDGGDVGGEEILKH